MTTQRTPPAITPFIRQFATEVRSRAEPIYLRVRPGADAQPLDCFYNVKREVDRSGGRMQFGWAVWEWPKVFVEAELHAVYQPFDGAAFEDITPTDDPEIKRRLFIPDDSVSYDFENEGVTLDNIRKAYVRDPLIEAFLNAASERSAFRNSIPGIGEIQLQGEMARQWTAIESRSADLCIQLANKYLDPNARCICGSGRKFRKCHAA